MIFPDMDQQESIDFLKHLKENLDRAITYLRDEETIRCAALLGALGQLIFNNIPESDEFLD